MNKAIIIGRLSADPEIKNLEHGKLATFDLATNESYTNKNGEKVENTDWHKIVVWNKPAEIIEKFVKKGEQIYIEGKIKTRKWEDKEGNKRYTTEIVVKDFNDRIELIGGKKESLPY